MIEFNNIKEIEKYYNEDTNTYEFVENCKRLDVKFNFDLKINANIYARDIDAWDINAKNIDAGDINARDIDAWDIEYYAVCFANESITCKSIKGNRANSKHFCLDGEIKIKESNNE